MSTCCQQDDRRDAVRRMKGMNGLDYVEVSEDQKVLTVFFLGKLPPEFHGDKPGTERFLKLEGGERVTGIQIKDVDPVIDPDPEKDDHLIVTLDHYGDFSTYTLRLVGVENIDPRYDHVDFSFKIDCPSDLDCLAACACEPREFPEPEINYLAKDYASFRQLILDRLALLMPDWKERHVPDLGIALVEALAYAGDYLSYYQDAVATEAYLDTARQRISVRRHVRLVDYIMHEGCNSRAWVSAEVSNDLDLNPGDTSFITGLNDALAAKQSVLMWDDLREVPAQDYEVFEPLVADRSTPIRFRAAHNEILFYTWGEKECCIERGSTWATLLGCLAPGDQSQANAEQHPAQDQKHPSLHLQAGDVLIFEEVLGPRTGLPADADPTRRHAVRLTSVTPGVDTVIQTEDKKPTPYVRVEWAPEDALPFTFCISTIGPAPQCAYLDNVSVVRGNVLLVDHGKTTGPEPQGEVATAATEAECECANEPGDIRLIAARFTSRLQKIPLTFCERLPADDPTRMVWKPASRLLDQDVRLAGPQVWLSSQPPESWTPRYDLIASGPNDRDFVVEIDNFGVAHLRFGDGETGYRPSAGTEFAAAYRVGNGKAGNVGAESISRLVLKSRLSGPSVRVRNPLPARGGSEPEPIAEVKVFAPHAFRKRIERAIIAADYEQITQRNAKVQRASAALEWTGSWYEADVAIDPFGRESVEDPLLAEIAAFLERYRRIGHDLAVTPARYVPIDLKLEVCALPHYQRAHVKADLLDVFSARVLPGGRRGFFHPDNLTFGDGVYLSRIIAVAQAVPGVECVNVTRLQRLFEAPNHEIDNGVLPLRSSEIAQLDNAPNFPEHGKLEIQVSGGR